MSKYNIPLILDDNNSHTKIIKRISSGSLVLEFGPAHGVMSQYLVENMGCTVYAVEYDQTAANDAAKFCKKIVVGSIEDYIWEQEFAGMQFDHIIFADVLEHLYNPWEVLKRVRPFLKVRGSVLISLPNIAHNAIIMNLLEDKFEYRPTGLLDNTHVRFFTKSSIDIMVEDCGYITKAIDAVFIQPQNTEFSQSYKNFNRDTVRSLTLKPNGHVYQFIYEVLNKDDVDDVVCQENLIEPFIVKVFYDTGSNFNEIESKMQYCVSGDNTIDLLADNAIERIRVDILYYPIMVHYVKLSVTNINDDVVACSPIQLFNYELCDFYPRCVDHYPQFLVNFVSKIKLKQLHIKLNVERLYISKED